MQGGDTDRYKIEDNVWSVQCADCGDYFEAKRSDATYCSARCRVHAARAPQRLKNALDALESMRREVIGLSVKYSKNPKIYAAIEKLAKSASGSLGNFDHQEKLL